MHTSYIQNKGKQLLFFLFIVNIDRYKFGFVTMRAAAYRIRTAIPTFFNNVIWSFLFKVAFKTFHNDSFFVRIFIKFIYKKLSIFKWIGNMSNIYSYYKKC